MALHWVSIAEMKKGDHDVKCQAERAFPSYLRRISGLICENLMNGSYINAFLVGDVSGTTGPVRARVQAGSVAFVLSGAMNGDEPAASGSAIELIAADGRGVILYLRQRDHKFDLIHQVQICAPVSNQSLDPSFGGGESQGMRNFSQTPFRFADFEGSRRQKRPSIDESSPANNGNRSLRSQDRGDGRSFIGFS